MNNMYIFYCLWQFIRTKKYRANSVSLKLCAVVLLLLTCHFSYAQSGCIVNIPDANFKNALLSHYPAIDTNYDGEISCDEAAAFTGLIDVHNKNIADMTGIEAFVNVKYLYAYDNQLTFLDVSQNTKLMMLYAHNNELTALDVSQNTALITLYANNNELTSLDVSNNTALTTLYASENKLTSLDVSNNTVIRTLLVGNNKLTALDVSHNTALEYLSVHNNELTSLDVSNNTALEYLSAFENELTSLDLSSNTALTTLYAYNNELTSLDVSNNTALEDLRVFNNELTSLNVSNNTALRDLQVYNNELTALDVSNNTALTTLWAYNNELTSLNVSNNTALRDLQVYNNELTALDVSNNTALTTLWAYNNELTSLNVSNNTALRDLQVYNNELTALDVSNNTALTTLWAHNNQLTTLNVKNGNNTNLTYFEAQNNPDLTCIEVDDIAWSNTKWTNKDATASYSEDCTPCIVNIPDANFKNYLLANQAINTNGDGEISCDEAVAFTGMINVYNKNIADLTGIEAFVNVKHLYAHNNELTSLDISNNTALTELLVYKNDLTSLDVSQNTALIRLEVYNNKLIALDVSHNLELTTLWVRSNYLTSLDVSHNTALKNLDLGNNELTSLDVSHNTALTHLYASENELTSLDVSNNTALTTLGVYDNPLTSLNVKNGNNRKITLFNTLYNPNLTCIQVDNVAYSTLTWSGYIDSHASFSEDCTPAPCIVNIPNANFKNALLNHSPVIDINGDGEIQCDEATAFTGTIDVSSKYIADLTGIEAFVNVTSLYVNNNQLTTIDVSHNTALTYLSVNNNQLTSLDVSHNTALENLQVSNNELTSLDVSENTALERLQVFNNELTSLDVSHNTALETLQAYDNDLTSLDVSHNTALTSLYAYNNYLTSLDVSQNTALVILSVQNNSLASLNVKNGNNTNFLNFDVRINLNLTCIEVDDATWSNTNWGYKPATASYSEDCTPAPCIVNIPDVNFKNALLNHSLVIDINGDGEIQCDEATAFTGTIDVSSKYIADLTGIEAFVNVTSLYVNNNQLTTIDVSHNTALTYLSVNNNQLTSLDVSHNTALENLQVSNNKLTSLDVSNNTALIILYAFNNYLTSLDVSHNIALTYLMAFNNQLTSLNVKNGNNTNLTYFQAQHNPDLSCIQVDDAAWSTTNWTNKDATASYNEDCTPAPCIVNIPDANFKNALLANTSINTNGDGEIQCVEAAAFTRTIDVRNKSIADLTGIEAFVNITELNAYNNFLTSLDVSNNTALTILWVHNNYLTSLDVSNNTALTTLYTQNNQLTSLNVKNGNNTNYTGFYAQNNPNLTCIQVDDAAWSTTNWTFKPATASYSEDCTPAPCIVNIPDANFKNALLAHTLINTNGDGEIQCDEATAYTEAINVPNLGITDLTGIEAFVNVTRLYAYNNLLTALDVSQNTELTGLYVYDNQLTALDVSNNTALTRLWTYNNQLTSFDISNNTALTTLYVNNNQLTTLNVKNGNNTNITTFYAQDNPDLTCIQVDNAAWRTANLVWYKDATASYSEDCSGITSGVFDDLTATYNGNAHSISVANLPNGTTVSYEITDADNQTTVGNSAINVGVYQIKATVSSPYGQGELNATLTIENATFTGITFDDATVIYDGNAHSIFVNNAPNGANASYNGNAQTNAGTYTVTATVSQANYNDLVLTADLTIENADFTGITFDNATVIYDGNAHSIFVSNAPNGATVDYDNNGQTNAGTYTVEATVSQANYNNLVLTADLTIEKADFTGITFDDATVTYNGNPHSIFVNNAPIEATVDYDNNGQTNAGTYTVTATVSQANYNDLVLTADLIIEKADFNGITFDDATVTYNGNAHSIFVNNAPTGATVDYDNNGQTNAGTYTVEATISQANYNDLVLTADLIIEKATFTGITFDDATVTYNGNPHSIFVNNAPIEATVDYDNNGQTNAGTYTVTATISQANYNDLVLTADLTIENATFTGITFDDSTVIYDGNAHSIFVNNAPTGATVDYDNNAQTNAGTYEVTATVSQANYNDLVLTADLTIEKADFTGITFDDATVTFDGNPHSIFVNNAPNGATVDYDNNAQTNAGTYTVTATVSQANYNDLVLTADLTIEKADFTGITFDDATVTYNGNPHSIFVNKAPNGATVDYDNNAQTNAGTYTVTATISQANYNDLVLTADLTIEKADFVGITFDNATVIYDGNPHSIFVNNAPNGANVSYNGNAQTNAGTYEVTATVSQANYKDLVLTADLVIEKATQIILFDALVDKHLENDSDFQLQATATSGLTVNYTYTFTTQNPAATVSETGWVALQTSGTIEITAHQQGNENYEAAAPVTRILQINSSDASIYQMIINGDLFDNPESTTHYIIDCDESLFEVPVTIVTETGATVLPAKDFVIDTPKAGIYTQEIKVTAQDGTIRNYTVIIEKKFSFNEIVVQKYDNVLLVNNNPETNGGYEFVAYEWYKNDKLIGTEQYYSAGSNATNILDENAQYFVRVKTKEGIWLTTCKSQVILTHSYAVTLAPNPVRTGNVLKVISDFPEEDLKNLSLRIFDMNGRLIFEQKSNKNISEIVIPASMTTATYIIQYNTGRVVKNIKFIVR